MSCYMVIQIVNGHIFKSLYRSLGRYKTDEKQPKHWYPKSWLRVCFVFAQGLLLISFLCPGSVRGMLWVCFWFALGQPLRSVLRKKVWSRHAFFLTACIFQIHIGRHVIFQQQFIICFWNRGLLFMLALSLLEVVFGSTLADMSEHTKQGGLAGVCFLVGDLFGTVVYIQTYHLVIHNYFNIIYTCGFFSYVDIYVYMDVSSKFSNEQYSLFMYVCFCCI